MSTLSKLIVSTEIKQYLVSDGCILLKQSDWSVSTDIQ